MNNSATFQQVSQMLRKHLEDRDRHDNPPRSIAISVSLEAAELLEHFQWNEESVGNKDAIAAEIADIFNYCFQLAQIYDIDIPEAMEKKLEKAALKYPAESFKGKSRDEQSKIWIDAKLKHRKSGL